MNTNSTPQAQKRLTLKQRIQVYLKTQELKRRWKNDAEFRNRVQKAVSEKAADYIKENVKHR